MKLSTTTTNAFAFATFFLGSNHLQSVAAQTTMFLPEQEQLEKAQALWKSKGIQHYQYQYTDMTESLADDAEHTFPWTISVNQGDISGHDAENNEITTAEDDHPSFLPTIDESFGLIQDQIDLDTAREISVTYDPDLGYPTNIYIHMADDTVVDIDNTNLAPLQKQDPQLLPISPSRHSRRQLWTATTEQARLDNAKALWDSKVGTVHHYRYEYTQLGGITNPVADGHPYPWTISKAASGITAYDAKFTPVTGHITLPIINAFFLMIKDQIDLGTAAQLNVQYDTTFGYPTQIFIVESDGRTVLANIANYGLVLLDRRQLNNSPLLPSSPSQQNHRQLWVPATEQARWTNAKNLWDFRAKPSYHYYYKYTETGPGQTGWATGSPYPWTITKNAAGKSGVDALGKPVNIHIDLPVMNALFNLIQQQITLATAKVLTVQYDPILGYPTYIYILEADGKTVYKQVTNTGLVLTA